MNLERALEQRAEGWRGRALLCGFHWMFWCKALGSDLLDFLPARIETVGQPDRRDSLGVCVEQQNGYDSLQRDKAVCISTNGESESQGWRTWSIFFPKTLALCSLCPWRTWECLHTHFTCIFCSVKILSEIVGLLVSSACSYCSVFDVTKSNVAGSAFIVICLQKWEITFDPLIVSGAVFVNGKEMTNQLPAVTSGSTVTFDMEVVQLGPPSTEGGNFKLRVTISSNNREVVFDWVLDQCCVSLYFGCSFSYPGWKVLVF